MAALAAAVTVTAVVTPAVVVPAAAVAPAVVAAAAVMRPGGAVALLDDSGAGGGGAHQRTQADGPSGQRRAESQAGHDVSECEHLRFPRTEFILNRIHFLYPEEMPFDGGLSAISWNALITCPASHKTDILGIE
ncbi:hypothetical protein ACFHYQ_26580 [Sphaerimonospora cavernae]|uniref:Secreted protein n=1 Tax=Sphaerimonospora cavernae TaxID=1740611 RepID=A0ABV6UCK3_9ACTN